MATKSATKPIDFEPEAAEVEPAEIPTVPAEPEAPPEPFAPGLWDTTAGAYYGDRECVSNSMLGDYIESPAIYKAKYVDRWMVDSGMSEAMVLGQALHTMILERNTFEDRFYVMGQKYDKRTKAGKEGWAAEMKAADGRVVLSKEHADALQAMVPSIFENREVVRLLDFGAIKKEQAYRWIDPQTGLKLRSKADMIRTEKDYAFIVDVKKTRDPRPEKFMKSVADFGYDRQAAFYIDGARECGFDVKDYFVIAVGDEFPHETVLYRIEDEAVQIGREKNREALDALNNAIGFDSWEPEYANKINKLTLPGWEFAKRLAKQKANQ